MTNENNNFQQDPNFQRFAKDLRQLDEEQINGLWKILQTTDLSSTLLQAHQDLTALIDDMLKNSIQSYEASAALLERVIKLTDRMKYAKLHVMDRDKLLSLEKQAEEEKKKLTSEMQFGA